jgi:MFS family permease
MFAVAGVIGPLVGGVLTDSLGWRWIFTVNLPIGGASLVITSVALKLPDIRREAKVDVQGALLLVAGVVCLVLITVWGGDRYAWSSYQVVGLAVGGLLLLALFVAWEARAPEPILPLRLLRNRVLTTILGLAFVLGPVYYVAGSFIPLFLQGVHGFSATRSGLMLAPNAAGLSIAAIVTGRLTTRTGRYKHWVIIGAAVLTADLVVLSRMNASWNVWWLGVLMVMVGLGLGCAMPVLNTAGQNAVEAHDLGVATSSVTFFRSLGGSFGVAVLGAVLKGRLDHLLVGLAPRAPLPQGLTAKGLADHPSDIGGLAQPLRGLVQGALAHSVAAVFLAALPLALVAVVLGWRLEERALRETTFAPPAGSTATKLEADIAPAPAVD